MAAKIERCPRCDAIVDILPSSGGFVGELTEYRAECICGLEVGNLSNNGTMRSAISDWNRYARSMSAANAGKV